MAAARSWRQRAARRRRHAPALVRPGAAHVMRSRSPAIIDWRAALCAGIAAAILSTLVQVAFWAAVTDALPAVLYRDARFAAAIVMGPRVLPPPARFDWG